MGKPYKEKARELEREANSKSRLAMHTGREYPTMISGLYEKAGDAWVKQANESPGHYPGNLLLYAAKDYENARKSAKTESERDRIKKKESAMELKARSLKRKPKQRTPIGFAYLAIASFLAALFFISFNLTGYAVTGQSKTNLSFLALGLFFLGLVFVFCYFKNKK